MYRDNYTLPTVSFIAGSDYAFVFDLYTETGLPLSGADRMTYNFTLLDYQNRFYDDPDITYTYERAGADTHFQFETGDEGELNRVTILVPGADTADRHGKYIYQLAVKDPANTQDVPAQGIADITRNANPAFVRA